ncbi:MAG: arginine--tRNA ligase [Cyanobium sp. MAG06]|nr:arginine--tRNA ligase [Cyanobium sp. MAG06]
MLLEEIKEEIRHILYKLSFITANESAGQESELFDFNLSFIDSLNTNLGDVSCNVAMILSKKINKSPAEITEQIKGLLSENKNYSKIEIKNNFINITLSEEYIKNKIKILQDNNYKYKLENNKYTGKNILVEYTDPNPFKTFHIGHLMQNAIGQSISNILELYGANIKRINYGGDIGLHVAKSITGSLVSNEIEQSLIGAESIFNKSKKEKLSINQIIEMLTKVEDMSISQSQEAYNILVRNYSITNTEYESGNEEVKNRVIEVNKKIYELNNNGDMIEKLANKIFNAKDFEEIKDYYHIQTVYIVGKMVSIKFFQEIYKILGSTFDKQI